MEEVENYFQIFERIAKKRSWVVNPDRELVAEFAKSLLENRKKYGIAICPCRLATGKREVDKLIICPCVYAEEDIKEFGRCYCGLYQRDEHDYSSVAVPDRHAKFYLE